MFQLSVFPFLDLLFVSALCLCGCGCCHSLFTKLMHEADVIGTAGAYCGCCEQSSELRDALAGRADNDVVVVVDDTSLMLVSDCASEFEMFAFDEVSSLATFGWRRLLRITPIWVLVSNENRAWMNGDKESENRFRLILFYYTCNKYKRNGVAGAEFQSMV